MSSEARKLYTKIWKQQNKDRVKQHEVNHRLKIKQGPQEVRDNITEFQKNYYQENKSKISKQMRERHLKIKYNLTSDQYVEMVYHQNNCCAICGNVETRVDKLGDIRPLCVDHNHTTGEVRELLCNDCNALLGFAKENLEVLENAIQYLQKHRD